jgi:hypothetical protein
VKQTKNILSILAKKRIPVSHNIVDVDMAKWHDFHVWLGHKEHQVTIPFAPALSTLIDAKAPRIRRDFTKILNLISAHALIHQCNRKKLSDGTIKANFKDYKAVHWIIADAVSAGVEATMQKTVRRAVRMVKKLRKKSHFSAISFTDLAKALQIHKSSAKRHVDTAIELGYLKNEEEKRGAPARIVLGEPMPADIGILPMPSILKKKYLAEKKNDKAA